MFVGGKKHHGKIYRSIEWIWVPKQREHRALHIKIAKSCVIGDALCHLHVTRRR
jgi:hypothetical protein